MITKFAATPKASAMMMRLATTRHQVFQATAKRSLSTAMAPQQQQWSEGLSYAAPETDFTAVHVSANSATMESEWSQELSFASPESDFTTSAQELKERGRPMRDAFGNEIVTVHSVSANSATAESEWAEEIMMKEARKDMERLSESMKAQEVELDKTEGDLMMNYLQFSSPDSALGFVHVAGLLTEREQEQLKCKLQARAKNGKDMPDCLPVEEQAYENEPSFIERMMNFMQLSSPESATGDYHVAEVMTETEKEQYKTMLKAQEEEQKLHSLPQSLQQALEDHERAIVVTTTLPPFEVVNVNEVWEGLCGYSRKEAQHKPIGELLHGPETESDLPRRVMARLVQEPGEEFDIPNLINYTKSGRKFVNHLHVGTMVDEETGEHYFVGVLQEQNKAMGMQL